jgi:hypothetical protein
LRIALRLSLCFLSLAWLAANTGCETIAPRQQLEWKPVQITDPSQVAGKWDGLLQRFPPSRRMDLVSVVIAPDGRFHFSSVKTIGVLSGEGHLTVTDGHLTATNERGSLEMTLHEADNQRMLKTTGESSDGTRFVVDLTPTKTR